MAEESQQPAEQQQPAVEQAAPAPAAEAAPQQVNEQPAQPAQPQPQHQRSERGRERGDRGGRPQRRDQRPRDIDESGIESSVVRIYRCAKVVKGGRTFSFGALVVAGDRKGSVGIGYGKANEVPNAVEKATKDARKSMFKVNLKGTTIPHVVKGSSGASSVVLVPARPGTGITAGKSVRPLLQLVGVTDILTKAYGSTSAKNLVKATMAALQQLKNKDQVEQIRGVSLSSGAGELVGA